MYRFSFPLAAAAVIFFCGAAGAARLELPAPREVKPVLCGLSAPATGQAAVPEAIRATDFDVFSVIDDPLYRESSKSLLEKAVKEDSVKDANEASVKKAKEPVKPAADLRDAPASPARPPLKKIMRVRKTKANQPVHTDPVKLKNSL